MEQLYERFGGLEAVVRLVFAFYDRVLRSPRLSPYFAKANMPRIIGHQVKLLSAVMGGPGGHTNAQLREIHANMRIDAAAFDEMARLLERTLRDFEFGDDEIAMIMADFQARRPSIVPPANVSPQPAHTA